MENAYVTIRVLKTQSHFKLNLIDVWSQLIKNSVSLDAIQRTGIQWKYFLNNSLTFHRSYINQLFFFI